MGVDVVVLQCFIVFYCWQSHIDHFIDCVCVCVEIGGLINVSCRKSVQSAHTRCIVCITLAGKFQCIFKIAHVCVSLKPFHWFRNHIR